jgi:hypothetical protein
VYHLLVDAAGVPLTVLVSAANRHDSLFVEPILDGMPAIKRGALGHPRRRPVKLQGDKGYDNPRVRRYPRRRGITARIGVDSRPGSGGVAGSSNAPWDGCPRSGWPCATTAPP